MSILRSKYYHKPKKDKPANIFILDKIKGIATAFLSYGYRRITAALRREGVVVNHTRKYIRIMQVNGICCSIRRSYKHTANSKNLYKDL